MSIHKSLKQAGAMARSRNVLTRYERMLRLQEEDRWVEGQSVYGLPKVRTLVVKAKSKKKKKKEEAEAAAGEGAPAAGAADAPKT